MLNNISTLLYSMLTKNQGDLIAERKGGKDKELRGEWKTGDYALRQALKNRLDSLADIIEIIDVLPDKQIKNIITSNQMADLLKVLEKLLELHPPIVVKSDEDDNLRAVQYFNINMGSRLRGLNDAVTGAEVSYLATEDEAEFWWRFRYIALHVFKHIMEDLDYDHRSYTQKEFNNLIRPIIEKREDVKVTPGGWAVGDPKEDIRDVDPLIDAKRRVLSTKTKKMIKERRE
jgi:hypothetical protein